MKSQVKKIMSETSLNEEEAEELVKLGYSNTDIFGVWKDWGECAYEEAFNLAYCDTNNERYFDFSLFESDIKDWEKYIELKSGRIVAVDY